MSIKLGVGGSLKNVSAAYLGVKNCWLNFDGIEDFVNANDVSTMRYNFPIRVKFKTNTIGKHQRLLGKRKYTNGSWSILIRQSVGSFEFTGQRDGDDVYISTILFYVSDNTEYDVNIIENGSNIETYVNGILESTVPTPQFFSYGAGEDYFTFGWQTQSATSQYFDGEIYYLQIGNDRLDFKECGGTSLTSSLGNTFSINNATWNSETILKQVNNIYLGNDGVLKTIL